MTLPESNLNPLNIGRIIWDVISPSLSKQGATFSEIAPTTKKVTNPTVTWRIVERSPGTSKGQFRQAQYLRERFTEDSTIEVTYNQNYQIILEYRVFAQSSTILDDIAWTLERAILSSKGVISTTYPGFDIQFLSQPDSELYPSRKPEGELRILRFKIQLPVEYVRNELSLQGICLTLLVEDEISYETPSTNLSLETHYPIIGSDTKVLAIFAVKRSPLTGQELRQVLIPGVDYNLEWDFQLGYYIVWISTGSIPAVGEEFWLTMITSNTAQKKYLR